MAKSRRERWKNVKFWISTLFSSVIYLKSYLIFLLVSQAGFSVTKVTFLE